MRVKFKMYSVCIIILMFLMLLFGCTKQMSPEELIKQKYANKEYTITFNSEELDKPINPIKYSMNRIPELPTPEKIGHIFLGWYFDKGYRNQYDDKLLLLKASDVMLYPKWAKEEFIEDGKYNIDFQSNIVQDTLVKGELADKYGYKDFSESISKEDTYIEKRGNKKILRINYDCDNTVMFGVPSPFEVSISSANPQIPLVEKNGNLSTSKKDIFLDITNHQLNKSIRLTVTATNYHTKGLGKIEREKTATTYDIEFKIEKIKGLGETYIDPRNGLADGHYLAKSFYRQIENKETMMSGFNPVYGYIVAENGRYKYVKEINPYYGFVGDMANLKKPLNENFYHRGTTFANFYSAYTIDFDPDRPKADEKGKGLIQSDYHPREYNAGKIIEYSLEYDSKTNRMWQVFDLGNRLDKHLVAVGAPTGFMEVVGMSGKISSLITIDYKTMLRVPPEYTPLEGDSYVFKKEGHFYPGYESDLASNGYAYEKQKEIGTTTEFPNFFYSAKNPTDKDGRIKSFRMTTSGSDTPLKNTKYSLQTVTERYEIFDYDVANECLIGDMMTMQKFNTNGWRNQHRYMANGKMLPFGTEINIKDLFDEKVSDSDVEYTVKAYKYSSVTQSFSEPVELSGNYFTFNQDINLNFEFRQNGFTKMAQVQLREYIEPEFNLNARAEDNFDESKTYFAGEKYNLPKGTIAKWGANQIRYLNDWYDDKENKKMQNIMYMVRYQKRNGIMHLISSDLKQTEDFVIEQGVKQETWIYYIHNIFGEVKRFEVTLKTEENPKYTIINSAGDKLAEKISRKDKDGNLFPEKTTLVASMDTEAEFKSYGNDTFKYNVVDKTGTFEIYKYYLITSETNEEEYVTGRSAPAVYDEIYEKVKARGGVVNVEYRSGSESFNIQFVVHGMFGDKKELKPIEHTTLFTGHKYMFAEKYIKDKDGNILARNSLEVHYTVDGKALYNSGQYFDVEEIGEGHKYITFKEPGKYRFYYKYYANNMFFIKSIEVEVKSNGGNVEVKYVTDSEHPFKDGSIEKTFTHNLKNEFSFLEEKYFDDKGDYLLGYTYKTTEYKKSPGYPYKIRSYIKEFNSDKIEIKVIWDKGSVVTLNLDKAKTGFDNVVADKVYKQSSKDKKYYFDNKMINIEEIIKKKADDINKKYILVGIKSSIFEGGYISIENYNKGISWRTASNSIEFELVYKRKLKLSYEMDSTYTNSFFKYHDIVEDEVFGEKNYKIPQLIGEYQDTHKFVGWYLKGDTSKTIIDFKTFIARLSQANANGVITVVAKFETK